ncbi:MAG TPA: hypothetical protein VGD91_23340 [Trebonia sp.]
MAFTSARNAPYSTGVRRMNASPSTVSASPGRGRAPAAPDGSGGAAGSRPTLHSAPANDTVSAR